MYANRVFFVCGVVIRRLSGARGYFQVFWNGGYSSSLGLDLDIGLGLSRGVELFVALC